MHFQCIVVESIGFGGNADQALLQQIAEETGGRFEQIDADSADTPDAQLEIQNYLIEILGEARDGSGIITMAPGLLPEPISSEPSVLANESMTFLKYTSDDLQQITQVPLSFRIRYSGYDHRAYVEQGSDRATFVVSYQQGMAVQFYLMRPEGSIVNAATDKDVTFINPDRSPYAFYVVNNPESGYWVMRVVRGQSRGRIPFKVFAFSENKALSFGIQGSNLVYRPSDSILLSAQAFHKVPLTGLQTPVVRAIPRDYSGRGSSALQLPKINLVEGPAFIDSSGEVCDTPVPRANGMYQGMLELNQPGSYLFEVEFVNLGQAFEASAEAEPPIEDDHQDPIPPIPLFMRTKRFQIHVSPLPNGNDVESPPLPFWKQIWALIWQYICK